MVSPHYFWHSPRLVSLKIQQKPLPSCTTSSGCPVKRPSRIVIDNISPDFIRASYNRDERRIRTTISLRTVS